MTIDEILIEIHRLPEADQKRLRVQLFEDSVKERVAPGQVTQREFDQALLAEGFLTYLPEGTATSSDFEPVTFVGKPISETLIDERR